MDAVDVVARSVGESRSEAVQRLSELTSFLRLVSSSGEPQTPSRAVDAAWHAVLAQGSENYQLWLSDLRLPNIQHVPGASKPQSYERTRTTMLDQGADVTYWGAVSGDCTGCSGDGGNGPD